MHLPLYSYICDMILTKAKQQKSERDARICKEYKELMADGSGSYAVIDHIAAKEGISANTVYRITEPVRSKTVKLC